MATATTKMKPTTASSSSSSSSHGGDGGGFLTGGGADLSAPVKKAPIVSAGTDQDDLDLFLSEITVQFDDEVQTLYVGPVEIVDDDEKDGKKASKGTSGVVAVAGPAKPQQKANDDVTKKTTTTAKASDATTRKTKHAEGKASEEVGEGVVGDGSGGRAEAAGAAATEVDSANDGRPHRLTATANSSVVIDPKDGENSQTEDLKKSTQQTVKSIPEKTTPPNVPAQATATPKPTAIISPSTKRKSPQQGDQAPAPAQPETAARSTTHQSQRINKRLKLTTERNPAQSLPTTPIKEEIKQLSPILPPPEEKATDEEELIVPDVLVEPQQQQQEEERYDKESSPAGSDSGIENEGAEQLSKAAIKTVEQPEEEEEHIPENLTEEAENGNTQEEGEVEALGEVGQVIKCAKCVMTFKHVLWYKKHLMNYHGIDLSNIAHFLSNLQTLDEGIHSGEGQDDVEEDYAEFQLEKGSGPDGGAEQEEEIDKTDNGEGGVEYGQQFEADGVAKLRQQPEASSTPSPNTLQMYPEVKLSTAGKPKQQVRRRKDKLIPINSDVDMKIKHEYVTSSSSVVQSEESAGSSQSTQPLINNMFVVKYLEQAALMVGAPNPNVLMGLPDTANKENAKSSGQLVDPLATEGDEGSDGFTPYERAKIVSMATDEGPQYTCTVCEAVFDERQAAQDHVNFVHKDVKRRSCPHCGRTFTQTGDLTRHVRIHTGIRPFKCPVEGCTFTFISSGDLHKHVRRHQQVVPKPHVCGVCGKDFERGYDLKRHSSMHAKDDPNFTGFSCELCGKTFARKDQYRAHTYRHIGYKPHKCTHCSKSFSDASNYSKHLKVHEMDGLILICHYCSKPFKNKMGISKHVLHCKYKHHPAAASAGSGDKPPRKKVLKKEEAEPAGATSSAMAH